MGSTVRWNACWVVGNAAVAMALCFLCTGAEKSETEWQGRGLISLKEAQGNTSYECSPSGHCARCQYSEKNDGKYRCSETGYRMPFKCVEIRDRASGGNDNLQRRNLLDGSSESQDSKPSYITYRSCLPLEPEERLSVFGFELVMVCLLLVFGPIAYFRQRRSITMAGVNNSRL